MNIGTSEDPHQKVALIEYLMIKSVIWCLNFVKMF